MRFIVHIRRLSLVGLLFIGWSCKDFVDINADPNNPVTPTLELLLPATQVSMTGSLRDVNQGTSILMQQLYSSNTSRNFQDGTDYQQSWNALYTQVLNDIEIIIREGTRLQRWDYVAIAKLEKAYIYSLMVDMWGDIPYTDATKGNGVSDPASKLDQRFMISCSCLLTTGWPMPPRVILRFSQQPPTSFTRATKRPGSAWVIR